MRNLRFLACAAVLVLVATSCAFVQSSNRYAKAPGSVAEPFWCAPDGGTALSPGDCKVLGSQLDGAVFFANAHHTAGRAVTAGATGSAYVTGVGASYRFGGPTATFNPAAPDTLLYDGTAAGAQVAGIEWNVASASAPAGFTGPNDAWDDLGGGVWRLRAWLLRPFQNEPDVFDDTHPCLGAGGPVYDVTAACYTATHTNPFVVLVSNDDGYANAGIDAAVEELRTVPNVEVIVSAPATNQSGTGRKTTAGPLVATNQTTLSGYPATAVQGFPADSVQYALDTLHVNPDLLVSGINDGQNISLLVSNISGTVGAARQGALVDIPAVAVSQGDGDPPDFPNGAAALRTWVDDFLLGRAGPALFEKVVNINIPTCTDGSIRGTRVLPLATTFDSGNPVTGITDCTSMLANPVDDIAGFLNGFITVTSIGTAGSITE
jgi:5'-nucleotidase